MQSISAFPDVSKFADFLWKPGPDDSKNGLFHVIYKFFGPSLDIIIVRYVWQILWRGTFSQQPPPTGEQSQENPFMYR